MTTIVVLMPDHGDPTLHQPRDPRWSAPLHLSDVDGSQWLLRIEVPILDRDAHAVAIYTPWAPAPAATVHELPVAAGAERDPPARTLEQARATHPSRRTP